MQQNVFWLKIAVNDIVPVCIPEYCTFILRVNGMVKRRLLSRTNSPDYRL